MQEYLRFEKRNVTPEKMVKTLAKHGTIITLEQAKIALDFLYKLSNLTVNQTIKYAIQHQKAGLVKEKYGKTKKQNL